MFDVHLDREIIFYQFNNTKLNHSIGGFHKLIKLILSSTATLHSPVTSFNQLKSFTSV